MNSTFNKITKYLFFVFIVCITIYSILYSNNYLNILKETCFLWFTILVPSILPLYFISNILLINTNLFKIIYKLTYRIFYFENITSCMLFFISFITSNPTMTILIKDAVDNKQISINEANRLMRCSNHFSIIFIKVNSRNNFFFIITILSLYIASLFILMFSKPINFNSNNLIKTNKSYDLYSLFDKSYQILLKILVIMIIINFMITFIKFIIPINNEVFLNFILSFLEITIGTNYFKNIIYNIFYYHFLFLILLSFSGVSLIIQIVLVNKKTMDILNFLKYRIVHLILSITIFLIFYGLQFLRI